MKKIQFWTLELAMVAMTGCKEEAVRVYENTAAADTISMIDAVVVTVSLKATAISFAFSSL